MSSFCQGEVDGKSSWPELVGAPGDDAVTTIEKENPSVTAFVVPPGSSLTTDIRCDHVRVFVDDNGKVTRVPVIG